MAKKGKVKEQINETFDISGASVESLLTSYYIKVPAVQRPNCWTEETISRLLYDIMNSRSNRSDYFIGNVVFHKTDQQDNGLPVITVLDGQQRLSTLFVTLKILQTFCESPTADGQVAVMEKLKALNAPYYVARESLNAMMARQFGVEPQTTWTKCYSDSEKVIKETAITVMEFVKREKIGIYGFIEFILEHVHVSLYLQSKMGSAIKTFRVLNESGQKLTNADSIKAMVFENLNEEEQIETAKAWEAIESKWDKFERLLSLVRGYDLCKKPRASLVVEYESDIFDSKERVKDFPIILARFSSSYSALVSPDTQWTKWNWLMSKYLGNDEFIIPLVALYIKFPEADMDQAFESLERIQRKLLLSGAGATTRKLVGYKITDMIKASDEPLTDYDFAESFKDNEITVMSWTPREMLATTPVMNKTIGKYMLAAAEILSGGDIANKVIWFEPLIYDNSNTLGNTLLCTGKKVRFLDSDFKTRIAGGLHFATQDSPLSMDMTAIDETGQAIIDPKSIDRNARGQEIYNLLTR